MITSKTELSRHETQPFVRTPSTPVIHQNQNQNKSATSDNNLPAPCSIVITNLTRKEKLHVNFTEEMQTEVFQRIKEEIKSLPLELQPTVVDWPDELISSKDFMQIMKIYLQNHHQSTTPAKLALLNFELRSLERVKYVRNNEHTKVCAIVKSAKKSFKPTQKDYFAVI